MGRRGINYLGDGVTDSRARQRSRIRFTVILTVKPGFQAYRECRKENPPAAGEWVAKCGQALL